MYIYVKSDPNALPRKHARADAWSMYVRESESERASERASERQRDREKERKKEQEKERLY
jgi:hypothetical protein